MLSSRRSLLPLSCACIKPFSAAGQSSFSAAAMAVTMLAAAARISEINASLDMISSGSGGNSVDAIPFQRRPRSWRLRRKVNRSFKPFDQSAAITSNLTPGLHDGIR